MLFAFIQRLFGRSPAPATVIPTPAAARPAAAPRAPARATGAVPRTAAPAGAAAPAGLGARRPLVATAGGLAGFEFQLPPSALRRRADDSVAKASTANLLGAMRLCTSQGLQALAELPADWLQSATDDQFSPGMHLVLRADDAASAALDQGALLQRLRAAGVRVGWLLPSDASQPGDGNGAAAGAGTAPDFLLLPPMPGAQADAWTTALHAAAKQAPGTPLVLLDLPDVDLLEALLKPPVALAACVLGQASRSPAGTQPLPPQAARLLTLLNRLVRDDDNALVVQDIKADAALSLGLLQHLNTAGASPGRVLESIDQAVQVLGRDALYRWVARMMVRLAPPRPAADALQAQALARARLLELLARAAAEPSPGSLYLLGLASMLPLLMQCPVEEAVVSLQLPPAAEQALIDQSGPWLRYLALAKALERHDTVAGEALAEPFGGLDEVLALSARAWAAD